VQQILRDTARVKGNDLAVYNEGAELLAAEKAEDLAARHKYHATQALAEDLTVSRALVTTLAN
jgi:hypothetical protein